MIEITINKPLTDKEIESFKDTYKARSKSDLSQCSIF
jgi:hypothetical protein